MCEVVLCDRAKELDFELRQFKNSYNAALRESKERLLEISRKEQELQGYERKLANADNLIEVLQSEVALLRYKVREATRVLGQTPRDSTEACNGVDTANLCDDPCAPVCNGGTLIQPCRDTGCDKCYPGWTPPA